MNAAHRFLRHHRDAFGTTDGLPGEFHRSHFFEQAKAGRQAAFVTPQGAVRTGRVVMKFATHAVLNLGGAHGTPGVMDATNCVFAAGATP